MPLDPDECHENAKRCLATALDQRLHSESEPYRQRSALAPSRSGRASHQRASRKVARHTPHPGGLGPWSNQARSCSNSSCSSPALA